MLNHNSEIFIEILTFIKDDWAFCDKSDDDSEYALVNENREEHISIKPQKDLISSLEEQGYIVFDGDKSDSRSSEREYMEFFDEVEPVWKVFCFKVTAKGEKVINE